MILVSYNKVSLEWIVPNPSMTGATTVKYVEPHGWWRRIFDNKLHMQWDAAGTVQHLTPIEEYSLIPHTCIYRSSAPHQHFYLMPWQDNVPSPQSDVTIQSVPPPLHSVTFASEHEEDL